MNDHITISGSIRRRLTLQLVGSAAVLALVLYLAVLNFARDLAERSQDNILLASATSILESVAVQADEITADIPYAALSMLGNISDDRVFYRVMIDDAVLTGYADLPRPEGQGATSSFASTDFNGTPIRMVSVSRKLSQLGKPVLVLVSVAQTRNGEAATLARIAQIALYMGIGFFALAVLLGIITAQSSIRPLQRLAEAVSRRGPKDLRPVTAPIPAEMAPLVVSLNRFIDRLRRSLSRSEDFIAEAAHRVRTPLATVRAQAELTLRRVEKEENRKSVKEMIRAIDESSRAAGQLLDHAMVSFRTDHLEREETSLRDLATELIDRLAPVADLKDIRLHLQDGPDAIVLIDPILTQNALRNVIDNAIKYSPPERTISVAVTSDPSGAAIQVTDQAGGFPPDDIGRVTDRFVRGSNTVDTIGSGLGLTIAHEVAEAHGGTLTITNTKDGACVALYFPRS